MNTPGGNSFLLCLRPGQRPRPLGQQSKPKGPSTRAEVTPAPSGARPLLLQETASTGTRVDGHKSQMNPIPHQ